MSFEDIPYSEGDAVTMPGFAQSEGVIESVEISEVPEVLCSIMVKLSNPDMRQEYCFREGDSWTTFFSLKE